ncbi:MAG: hypothetical protein LBR34_11015 [Prevotella sp.]|jgi:hypothetical protein|nr:hypothetical protein [Prevotella sp.]
MKHTFIILLFFFFFCSLSAQDSAPEAPVRGNFFSSLQLGGYGEMALSRNFYSGNVFRYRTPDNYRNDPSHGRFDLPHVVFFVGYEFGNGWRMNSEIEFEHGGAESAMEVEPEEGGEYEQEVERGGEVTLEQFWIEKTFSKALNLRMGHIIVPVGLTNGNHLPTQFFTVYRSQGESTILPCTWHETGVSLWGRISDWRYEALLVSGLDSELFGSDSWIAGASASPYEFKVANTYAGALRIDNYSVRGLRLGVSAYYGYSFKNGIKPAYTDKYKDIKGDVFIGSFDFEYKAKNWLARGYFDYGHLGDAQTISVYNKNLPNQSASPRSAVAEASVAAGVEVGYDVFSCLSAMKIKKQKLYLFGRYEYYDSMYKVSKDVLDLQWCGRQVIVGGINWYPIREVVLKAEYSAGLLKKPFIDENAINIGVAYSGFFK